MKKSRFREDQIVRILKEYDAGIAVSELIRKYQISSPTFYAWKSKYGGMDASQLKRLKELEAENGRLKYMVADLSLDNRILKDVIEKKL
jgi:putative transposase